jgi:hypothetical protein
MSAERANENKPHLVILPRGISAEEAAKLLKEWAEQHQAAGRPADADADAKD